MKVECSDWELGGHLHVKVLLMTLFKKKNNGGDDVGERVFIVAHSLVLIFCIFYIKYSEISEYF